MRLNPFRKKDPDYIAHVKIAVGPTPSDHARALGQMGLAAQSDAAARQRAKVRAMARELCRCTGKPVPPPLQEKDA